MGLKEKIRIAYDLENVSENYPGILDITDLRDELGTRGHVLVVRGDKAYRDRLAENEIDIATPKLWLYENLIGLDEIQEQLKAHPNHKLFDGVGFSSLAALGYHAKRMGRKSVVVMARQHVPTPDIVERYDIEVINAVGQMEEGYIKAQADVIKHRDDIIPLHQALYGARALAPIGNNIVEQLKDRGIKPDATFWCLASGANLYGIGRKIKQHFPDCKTVAVEPSSNRTLEENVDFSNRQEVKQFAGRKLHSNLDTWVKNGRHISPVFPLHAEIPNRYLLDYWKMTGDAGLDNVEETSTDEVYGTQKILRKINLDYDWTLTTALTLAPAIKAAEAGNNVLVMAYGKNKKAKGRDASIERRTPWILRWETPLQKAIASGSIVAFLTLTSIGQYGIAKASDEYPEVMKYFPFIN